MNNNRRFYMIPTFLRCALDFNRLAELTFVTFQSKISLRLSSEAKACERSR